MKHLLITILLFAVFFNSWSQNFENQWTGHFSYASIKAISQGNDKIFAGAENAIFSYDLSTQELETISSIQGLSGELISTIYYSENFDLLLIGYENGLIEVVRDGDEDILTVVDILNKPTIPPTRKRINQFNEYEGNVYIAADFGVSVFNLERLEFGDTYFIGDGGGLVFAQQTEVVGSFIYVATRGGSGLRRADVNSDNLIDFQEWSQIRGGNFFGAQELGGQLYVAKTNEVIRITSGSQTVANFNEDIVGFESFDNKAIVTTASMVNVYDSSFGLLDAANSIAGVAEFTLQSGFAFGNSVYLGTEKLGLYQLPIGNSQGIQLLPNGPLFNSTFSIAASPGQLWLNYGDVDVDFNPFPLTERGISNLREGEWFNIRYEELTETLGKEANDLVRVRINPDNPNEVFMSSFQRGILQIEDQTPVKLFDETNSSLEITYDNEAFGIRVFGIDYDNQGNLWALQAQDERGLLRISPEGQLQQIDISGIFNFDDPPLAFTDLETTRENYVFFGAFRDGLTGYDPNSGRFNKIGTELGNGNLPDPTVNALATDNNNRLWIGTVQGLRVLFNPGSFFEEDANTDTQAIIILEDGVPQELLFEQTITDIEVDGSNNKWIATATSGVFYLSPNGQETLLRFTKDNSPLPSNNVQDIAIDNFSGVVYFATTNGLVAFNGSATAPRDNLDNVYAFPNPVRPGFTGNVTIDGLTANANVKITDISGNLVFETTSEGGSVLWDTTAFGKYKVASGVYMVLITGEDAVETNVAKIMVVR